LDSYEGQNKVWYGFENKKEEEEQASDSKTQQRPACSIAARHSRVIGRWRGGSSQGSKR